MTETTIKIIIAGSRNFNDYDKVCSKAKELISEIKASHENPFFEIVSGGAKGVDTLGERFAKEKNFELIIFPADWSKYGRVAGPKRNAEMANYATHLLSFWDGKSKGTKSMISLAEKKGLSVKIVDI